MVTTEPKTQAEDLRLVGDVTQPEVVAETTPEEPKPKTEGQPTLEETQAKLARLDELERENAKIKADLKSVQTGVMRQAERDRKLDDILERLERNERKQDALTRALANNETDGLLGTLTEIDQEAKTKSIERSFDARAATTYLSLQEAVQDEDGKAILDLRTAPELEEQRVAWNDALQRKDLVDMATVVADVHKVTRKVLARNLRAEADQKTKDAGEQAKRLIASKGVNDLSGGRPASGAAGIRSADDAMTAYISGGVSLDDLKQLSAETRRALHDKYGLNI